MIIFYCNILKSFQLQNCIPSNFAQEFELISEQLQLMTVLKNDIDIRVTQFHFHFYIQSVRMNSETLKGV